MQRRLLTLLAAALGLTIAVPLWASLTFDQLRLTGGRTHEVSPATADVHLAAPAHPLAEAGSLVVTSGVLFGLATALRRTA